MKNTNNIYICSSGGTEQVLLDCGGQCPLHEWNSHQYFPHCRLSPYPSAEQLSIIFQCILLGLHMIFVKTSSVCLSLFGHKGMFFLYNHVGILIANTSAFVVRQKKVPLYWCRRFLFHQWHINQHCLHGEQSL